ncbi:MAG: hypothetical protein HY556_08390 [Euryarchaeota archaeon]|nr:hypothetical protein [Euryarchaeota archaeon]
MSNTGGAAVSSNGHSEKPKDPFNGALGDPAELRVLVEMLSAPPNFAFSRAEIASGATVSPVTLERVLLSFRELKIVSEKKVGRVAIYQLNRDHPVVFWLDVFMDEDSRDRAMSAARHATASDELEHTTA